MRSSILHPVGALLLLSFVIGCGSGEPPKQKTYPVTGEVRLDGNPVPNATIVFHPLDKSNFKWDERPQAMSDAQGKFKVFTYASDDGAPAGEYKVGIAVFPVGEEGEDQVKRVKGTVQLDKKYASADTSGITAKVNSAPTVLPPFELKSK